MTKPNYSLWWEPIETCPESTWVLTYAEWMDKPFIGVGRFHWETESEWETTSETQGASGARRQIRQEKLTKKREWEGFIGDYWMPLPKPPSGKS